MPDERGIPSEYEREFTEDSQPSRWNGEVTLGVEGRRARENFVPVSERLRLHYIEGAHAGLRGEWARIIREETAMLASTSRRWRRTMRDIRDQERDGQYLPPDWIDTTADEEMPF